MSGSRCPNPAVWATRDRAGFWWIRAGTHTAGAYTECVIGAALTEGHALAWLTDHRRRNPR